MVWSTIGSSVVQVIPPVVFSIFTIGCRQHYHKTDMVIMLNKFAWNTVFTHPDSVVYDSSSGKTNAIVLPS